MLQLSGKITYQFGNKELIVDRVELLCRNQNLMLSTELEQCKHYFTQRERLISPWVYTPPEDRICITIDDDDDIDSDNSDDIGIQRFNYINVKSLDEITCHFINWILSNDKLKFKLLDLYSDPLLSQLIENQTVHDPNKPTKSEVFHSIRRHIQIDCKLILITKSQNVYCSDLFKVVKFIADELEKAKEQNSELELSEIQGGILGILRDESTLNILYVNEIIKWLVKFEENEWKYIDERETWVYDADEQNPLVQEDTLEDILIKETFEEHEELTLDDIIIEDSIIILD